MIKSFVISGVGSYRDGGAEVKELGKVNFMYGGNGCGKTTISRVLANADAYPLCSVEWDGETKSVVVYNRDFVEMNFSEDVDLPGVFTLGSDGVELRSQLESLQEEESRTRDRLANVEAMKKLAVSQLGEARVNLEKHCWLIKTEHGGEFRNAFQGAMGSKESFANRTLLEWSGLQADNNYEDVLVYEDLVERNKVVGQEGHAVRPLLPDLDTSRLHAIEEDDVLLRPIVGGKDSYLSSLITRAGISDWVRAGIKHLGESGEVCPFCQQSVSGAIVESLKKCFDDAYGNDVLILQGVRDEYLTVTNNLRVSVDKVRHLLPSYPECSSVLAMCESVLAVCGKNLLLIEEKVAAPSRTVNLESTRGMVVGLKSLVGEVNRKTEEYNNLVKNIEVEKAKLKKDVWRYVLNVLADGLADYEKTRDKLSASVLRQDEVIARYKSELVGTRERIRDLERKITNTRSVADSINRTLVKFGFDAFSVSDVPGENRYRLVRAEGSSATKTLSEGERTLVSFLYFFHLVDGSTSPEGVMSERVVVIDDPVSSLDSGTMFVVSQLVRSIASMTTDATKVSQLLVLTHNAYFHKEVAFKNRKAGKAINGARFYTVNKSRGRSCVVMCEKDPVDTVYNMLWSELKSESRSVITTQNVMRRIIENYFEVYGNLCEEDIVAKIGHENLIAYRSLMAWNHDGSHRASDDLHISRHTETVQMYDELFMKIFHALGHQSHYEMMMKASQ